ncbi:hypothetical protein [Weissella soli]|uniref:hypothetical protein n=1 Tax=Weissella soli TaxID=155866 RepID=UPI0035A11CA4
MQAIAIEPQQLIDVMIGQKANDIRPEGTDYRGELVIASQALKQVGLPSNMAGVLVNLTNVVALDNGSFDWQFELIALLRPFKVHGTMSLFEVDDAAILREPANWFNNAEEDAAHEKIGLWINSYIELHPELDRIPRQDIPEDIATLALSFDQWRLAYFDFIYKPTKQQKIQFRKVRYDVEPLTK